MIVAVLAVGPRVAAGDKPLTFEELMDFRQIRGAVLADDGFERSLGSAGVDDSSPGKEPPLATGADTVAVADPCPRSCFSVVTPAPRTHRSVSRFHALPDKPTA